MDKLNPHSLRAMIEKPGRRAIGGGLYFRVIGEGKAYFVYRFRFAGREREMSLGPYPETSLAEARQKHAKLRTQVEIGETDPLAERWVPAAQRAQIVERLRTKRKRLIRDEAPDLTHLYRHYDFDGKLLYVGVSNNVLGRWDGHKHKATWADQVAVITVDHYPTREEAEDAEANAIITEKPRFNGHVMINRQELRVLRRSRRKVWPKPENASAPAFKAAVAPARQGCGTTLVH
jgi:hypothetical protein